MVTALSRAQRELNNSIIEHHILRNENPWEIRAQHWHTQTSQSPKLPASIFSKPTAEINTKDFPYALREFINDHMNLPTLEELTQGI